LSATALRARAPRRYADASALVKLVILEPESSALIEYLGDPMPRLLSSQLAVVEVTRAAKVAMPEGGEEEAARVLASCDLLDVAVGIVRRAAALASERLRALDAVHLASVLHLEPDEVLAYDQRLVRAARELGFAVAHPGAEL
jgi:uncharacterized protein